MVRVTPAEHRAFQRLTREDGRLVVVAVDQRASLRAMLTSARRPTSDVDLYAVKRDLVEHLGARASAVLADPEVALPRLVDDGVLASRTGLLVAVEQTDPPWVNGLRRSALLNDFGPSGVRSLGGDAAKILVYLRPDREGVDSYPAEIVRRLIAECSSADLLVVTEVVVYPLPGQSSVEHERTLPTLVPEAVALMVSCGAKFLKLQYPGSPTACARVSDAGIPWAVLSGGASFDHFSKRLRVALDNGASGFIAGRALWQESVAFDHEQRRSFLADTSRRRLDSLASLLDGAGQSWQEAAKTVRAAS